MNSSAHLTQQSPEAAAPVPADPVESLSLSIAEYGIGMVLPPTGEFEGTLKLDCGAAIYGRFRGTLECKRGAVVIAEGGDFTGRLIAERIIIAGRVGDVSLAAKDSALIIAGEELRIGATANVHGVLRSPHFVTAKGANLNSSVIKSVLLGA